MTLLLSPQFDGERDLRTPPDFTSGGANVSRMDDMGDDDDDGDADDSPTAQYVRQDSLKGKSDPEGSQVTVTRPKLEPPDVRSILVSEPLLISPPRSITGHGHISTCRGHYPLLCRLSLYPTTGTQSLTHPAAGLRVHRHPTSRNLQIPESVRRMSIRVQRHRLYWAHSPLDPTPTPHSHSLRAPSIHVRSRLLHLFHRPRTKLDSTLGSARTFRQQRPRVAQAA